MAPAQTRAHNIRTPVARGLTSFDVVLPDSRRNSPHADAQDVCFSRECWPQVVFGATAPASGRLELPVEPVKHRKAAVVGADSQHPAPGMLDHSARFVHQLLHHRLDTPTFGRMANRCVRSGSTNLNSEISGKSGYKSSMAGDLRQGERPWMR